MFSKLRVVLVKRGKLSANKGQHFLFDIFNLLSEDYFRSQRPWHSRHIDITLSIDKRDSYASVEKVVLFKDGLMFRVFKINGVDCRSSSRGRSCVVMVKKLTF